MSLIVSRFGSRIGTLLKNRSYWAVRLADDRWLCEIDPKVNIVTGEKRELGWLDDIIANGDIDRIRELWMFCPVSPGHPFGQTAHLKIKEPGTAFVLNGRALAIGGNMKYQTYQAIGRVDDKLTGGCAVYVWDHLEKRLYLGQNNVHNFQGWREGVAPLGMLAINNMGLRL